MELVHYTRFKNIEGIRKHGLIRDMEGNGFTRKLNTCLNPYKPEGWPEFLDLNRCVFLAPINSRYGFHENPSLMSIYGNVRVLSRGLNEDKLYTAPYSKSSEMTSLVNTRTAKIKDLNKFEELCRSYWDNIVPFSQYQAKYSNVNFLNDDSENVEVLYFGNIPPNKIWFKKRGSRDYERGTRRY